MAFPKDFIWGSATSSYQIEGGGLSEGRGECIWHRFSHTPGKVVNGETGDVACDHLHRYPEDVALMKSLGLQAYRLSASWPRVLPAGIGPVNEVGVGFYDRLVDELLKAGIDPYVTLYHWDFPQALQDKGGWANPDSVQWFAEYADLMTRSLGDRVKGWITHNEPWCTSLLSYLLGEHAPGLHDPVLAYKVAHHVLISHGAAMGVIRQNCPKAEAGITLNYTVATPASDSEADQQATWYFDGWFNRWFTDPVMRGEYPADMVQLLGGALDGLDLSAIKQAQVPMDFLGVNYYTRAIIQWTEANWHFETMPIPPDATVTDMPWEVYPQGLQDLLVRLHTDYAPKALVVTENGCAYGDSTVVDGVVEDPRRVAYLKSHFAAAENAIEQGAPVKGYFVWSLLDNFEWAQGYDKRFGIVHVDFETQKRTPKRSALYLRDTIASMG